MRGFTGLLALVALPALAQSAAVKIDIDAGAHRRTISPLIYGVAYATQAQLEDLNAPLNRRGGNATSRYNWQLNADNRAADWYFESQGYPSPEPGAVVDEFVTATRGAGAEPLVTIPMVGWVAKLGAGRSKLSSFSIAKYGTQQDRDVGWFTDAGNGVGLDGAFLTNDPNDANVPADAAFHQDWVRHLVERWGPASSSGVRYYVMDNEPSLWHATHRDVHPVGATMEEVRDKHLAHAAVVKSVDPNALIMGPEEWGWSGFLYSGLDHQEGPKSGYSHYPDREAHGGWDYLPWLLDQFRQDEARTGRRLLDVLTVHYYPQGGEFSTDTSPAMQLRRNRSTRSLWDPNYTDETWINDKVMLVPRLKRWVAQHYPGTQVGITEYNWGAEAHISGALAQADILGIFGREGLDYATRWETPATSTPTFQAMKLYRNHDGRRSSFGDVSVTCTVPDPDTLSAFAAERTADGALTVMAVSKVLSGDTPVTLRPRHFHPGLLAQRWELTAAGTITRREDVAVDDQGQLTATLPPQSITLFVLPPNGATPVNLAPVASAVGTNTTGLAPLVADFDGSGSTDTDGTLVSYAWDFGDGQGALGPTARHAFTAPGDYTVTLTVTDDAGATASMSVAVKVNAATTTLAAPTSLYTKTMGGQVRVYWTDNAQGEEGYIIERCPATWPMDFQEVGRVGANATSYADPQPPAGSHFYRVRAFTATTTSLYSNMDGTTPR